MRLLVALLLAVAGTVLALAPGADALPPAPDRPRKLSSSTDEGRAPSTRPCPGNLDRGGAEPLGPGPARLAAISCLDLPRGQDVYLPPILSPDGRRVAFWGDGQAGPLDFVPLDGSPGFRLSNRVMFRNFGSGFNSRQDALAWRSDGAGLWSVEQQLVVPNGWARGQLVPILIGRGGAIRRFAPPAHRAGPLDALAWVGGEGRAIVQFGTRGSRYRPEHNDPSPTLAMADIPRRRILHSLTAADHEALRLRSGSYNGFSLFDVAAVQLANGRLRALLQLERVADPSNRPPRTSAADMRFLPAVWLVWTEGRKPAPLTPYFDDRFARAILTPDGSQILDWRPLQPDGMIIDDCRNCPPPPPPKPVEAAVAALIDARSGRTVWSLKARASEFWNRFGGPVISPTGRLALIPLPGANGRQLIGLLSMADGRILQRFSLACNGCYPQSFGFTRGGRQMWIGMPYYLAFYDLE